MSVRVYFIGVCTHICRHPAFTPWLEVPHRVVLLAARTEQKVGECRIPPHESKLIINHEKPIDIGRGVTVSIGSGVERVEYDESYPKLVPRLLDLYPGLLPAPHIVQDRDHNFADAYVDITRGKLRPVCAYNARAVEWEIDDPSPVLTLRWWSRWDEPEKRPLASGSTICVVHTASGANEDDHRCHFLLHHGIAGPLLELPVPDLKNCTGEQVPSLCLRFNSLGPGCSDSNYP